MSAVVESVRKSSYPLSGGEPGCVLGVMVTRYNSPEENNNKGVLFRTMLKSNFPGISKARFLCPGVVRAGDRFTVLARRTLSNLAMDCGFAYFAKRIKFHDKDVDLPGAHFDCAAENPAEYLAEF